MPASTSNALSTEEFVKYSKRLYGSREWMSRAGRALGLHRATVSRYAAGKLPVSDVVSVMLRELYAKHRAARAQARVLGGK